MRKQRIEFFQFLNLNKWKNTKLPLSNRRYPFTFRVLTFAVSVAVLAFFCVVASSQILPQGYTCFVIGCKGTAIFRESEIKTHKVLGFNAKSLQKVIVSRTVSDRTANAI